MTADRCREWRERLGALVLDQLPADERAATQAHLEGCPQCQAEVSSLRPLRDLLPLADPMQFAGPAPAPPPELAEQIAQRIATERRAGRRRARIRLGLRLSAATAALAAALIAALLIVSPTHNGPVERVSFGSLPRGVRLAAELRPHDWGTEIRMRVSGMRSGTLCNVFLKRSDGGRVFAGSFRYRYSNENEQEVLGTALDISQARAIAVRAENRTFIAPLPRS